jgi:hypothetical protein
LDASLLRDLYRAGELIKDRLGIRFPPTTAMLTIIFWPVDVQVVAMLAHEANQVDAFGKGIESAIKPFNDATDLEWRWLHQWFP